MTEFESWLSKGLGRAVLFLRGEDGRTCREPLLHACRNRVGYDPQCELSRAAYLVDLLDASGEPSFYHEQILRDLAATHEDHDLEQMFEVAALLAERGSVEARNALFAGFAKYRFADAGETCAERIVWLDGMGGLVEVMRHIERQEQDERVWTFGSLLSIAEEKHGPQPLPAELEPWSIAWTNQEPWPSPPLLTYEQIKQEIVYKGRKARPVFWGKRASDAEIQRAAADLLAEQDGDRMPAYLRIFQARPFPGPLDRLLALAEHDDADVAGAAMMALAHRTDPAIRTLGLRKVEHPNTAGLGVNLLIRNRGGGDYALFERLLKSGTDEHQTHWVDGMIRDYVAAETVPAAAPSLLLMCERDPCSICRKKVRATPDRHRPATRPDARRVPL